MNYILTMLFASSIVLSSILRPSGVILIFVILLAMMPRYLGIPVGIGILPTRAILISLTLGICMILALQSAIAKRKLVGQFLFSKHLMLISLSIIILSASVSIYLGHMKNSFISSLTYDFLNSVGVLIVLFTLSTYKDSLNKIVLALTIGLLISECLAIIEFFYQHTLLSGLIDESQISGTEFFADRSRGGQYRVRALFDNHLMFSEFVSLAWPFAWVLYKNSNLRAERFAALGALILTPLALYMAGARSGLLCSVLGFALLIFLQLRSRVGPYLRWFTNMLILLAVASISYGAVVIFNDPTILLTADDSSNASTMERIGQYLESFQLFMGSPWIGYGKGLDLDSSNFLEYIDSYLLVVLLEGGILGILFFLWLWALIWKQAAKLLYVSRYDQHHKNLALGLSISSLALMTDQLFISVPWNNIYLFLIAGLMSMQLRNLSSHHKIKEAKG